MPRIVVLAMSEQHVDAALQAHLASGGGEINLTAAAVRTAFHAFSTDAGPPQGETNTHHGQDSELGDGEDHLNKGFAIAAGSATKSS